MYYTTYGDVRGGCNHRHRTRNRAEECLWRDQNICASQRGYSDRSVVAIDADGYMIDPDTGSWIAAQNSYSHGAIRFRRNL